jgi:hypothetical protein
MLDMVSAHYFAASRAIGPFSETNIGPCLRPLTEVGDPPALGCAEVDAA